MYHSRGYIELLNNELRKKGVLTFETREELIEMSSEILAFKYLNYLEYWRCTAMDDPNETKYWMERINCEVELYRLALKREIEKQANKNKKWKGTKIRIGLYHKKLIKKALRAIGKTEIFACGIPTNVKYIIDFKSYKIEQITC